MTLLESPTRAAGDGSTPPGPPPTPRRPRTFKTTDVAVVAASAVSAASLVWVVFYQLTQLSGVAGYWLCWFLCFLAIYWGAEYLLNGRLVASDRLIAVLVTAGALALIVPLVMIISYLFIRGYHYLTVSFLTHDQRSAAELGGIGNAGIAHAIVGTIEQVAFAMLLGVPVAILTAIYLNEVGGRLTRTVRIIVTAMSGLPSIVAGIFIYAVWIVQFHNDWSGFAGALALSVMLLPSVTRTTEEVLKVVPSGLREASMAMGAPDWRTTFSVVLPTARRGIVTAVLLGVARAVGETAPLIVTIFGSNVINWNLFHGPQEALPLFIWTNLKSPLAKNIDEAWTAALVLVIMVLVLFTLARILGSGVLSRRKSTALDRELVEAADLAFTARGTMHGDQVVGFEVPEDDDRS